MAQDRFIQLLEIEQRSAGSKVCGLTNGTYWLASLVDHLRFCKDASRNRICFKKCDLLFQHLWLIHIIGMENSRVLAFPQCDAATKVLFCPDIDRMSVQFNAIVRYRRYYFSRVIVRCIVNDLDFQVRITLGG